MSRPSVSAIVPAHNAEATLGDCLAALERQTCTPAEIIVFLDGATDSSEEIAHAYGAVVLKNDGLPLGPAHGRNAAAAAASSDLIWFVDADVIAAPTALELLVADMQSNSAAAAFGSYDDKPRSRRATSLYANLRHHFVHQQGRRDATTFWSGIGLIERAAFLELGGFDAQKYPYPSVEDVELGMRLIDSGRRIRLVPEALGTHCKDWSLWRVWHTDIVRRAYPWTVLLHDRRTIARDLNLAKGESIKSVVAVLLILLCAGAILQPLLAIPAVLMAATYVALNARFFRFLAERVNVSRLIAGASMHYCYHVYAAATYALVTARLRLGDVSPGPGRARERVFVRSAETASAVKP